MLAPPHNVAKDVTAKKIVAVHAKLKRKKTVAKERSRTTVVN